MGLSAVQPVIAEGVGAAAGRRGRLRGPGQNDGSGRTVDTRMAVPVIAVLVPRLGQHRQRNGGRRTRIVARTRMGRVGGRQREEQAAEDDQRDPQRGTTEAAAEKGHQKIPFSF